MRRMLLLCLLVASGCDAGSTAPEGFRVGLVFDVGGRGDKSFNDAADRGVQRAKAELGIVPEVFEPHQPADRESGLRRYAASGMPLIIGVGFLFTDDIQVLAKDFPNLKFACVDMNVGSDPLAPNLVALKFREEEGAFLVGAIAGLVTKTGTIGFVGGMKMPLLEKFQAGYAAGAKHVRPDTRVLVAYAGENPEAFKDPAKGKSLALGMYEQGADIIFHASGSTGRGVFEAAREKDKLAIGVDSDQHDEAPGHVLTSMIKRVDVAVFDVIKSTKDGAFPAGVHVFGLKEDGLGYVYDDRNKALVGEDNEAKVRQLRRDIIDGKIQVPDRP